jgi:hypothetical protein
MPDLFRGNSVPLLKNVGERPSRYIHNPFDTDCKKNREDKDPLASISQREGNMTNAEGFSVPYETTSSGGSLRFRNSFRTLKSRKHAILASLIHLPSVIISLGVLSLTFRRVFWEAPAPETNGMYPGALNPG